MSVSYNTVREIYMHSILLGGCLLHIWFEWLLFHTRNSYCQYFSWQNMFNGLFYTWANVCCKWSAKCYTNAVRQQQVSSLQFALCFSTTFCFIYWYILAAAHVLKSQFCLQFLEKRLNLPKIKQKNQCEYWLPVEYKP